MTASEALRAGSAVGGYSSSGDDDDKNVHTEFEGKCYHCNSCYIVREKSSFAVVKCPITLSWGNLSEIGIQLCNIVDHLNP